jgi:Predicted xylanase/chitin deacetylase
MSLTLFIVFIVIPIAILIGFPQLHGVAPFEDPYAPAPQAAVASTYAPSVYYSNKAVILMYHHFDDHETPDTISLAHFREQIAALEDKGYNFISLEQLRDFLDGKQELPPNAVAITFDDGYQSVYKYAYPVLTELNIPASCFLIVKNVGATAHQIPKLTWDQIKEMHNHGITFYSHSYNSHRLVKRPDGTEGSELNSPMYLPAEKRYENATEYQNRVYNDLLLSTTILEKNLNTDADFLALPYGCSNGTINRLAREVGIHYILTVTPGMVDRSSDKLALNRINAGQAGLSGEQLHNLILSFNK